MSLTPAEVHRKKDEITADGGIFEMEDIDLDGHSYRAYKHAPKTLVEVLQGARAHGDLEFIVYEGQRFTYTEFFARVDALAASLQVDFGVKKGDRIAIWAPNIYQWITGLVKYWNVNCRTQPEESFLLAGIQIEGRGEPEYLNNLNIVIAGIGDLKGERRT